MAMSAVLNGRERTSENSSHLNAGAEFTPPDYRGRVLDRALRRFFGRSGKPVMLLFTDRLTPTYGWLGITDPEVQILVERQLARLGPVNSEGRRCVLLTVLGIRARDALARTPR